MSSSDRPGGRTQTSLRPLSCELSCLQNSDGSALFRSGSTHVLASVHGPIAPRLQQHEDSDKATISVIIKSGNLGSTYEREWEDLMQKVLSEAIITEAYPRSVIQVVIQIMAADGSVLATAVNAAVSALLDAGIEMRFLPTAITCLVDDTVRLDPSEEEEMKGGIVVLVTAQEKVIASHTSNIKVSVDKLLQCTTLANRASPAIVAFWRLAIEQKLNREAQTLWASSRS